MTVVKYLILSERRIAAGAVTITLYFVFLLPFAAAYLRVLWTIYTAPGLVPKGLDTEEALKNEKIGNGSDSDPEMGLGSVRSEFGNFGNAGTPRPGTATTGTPYREPSEPKDLATADALDSTGTDISMPDLNLIFPSPVAQVPSRKVSETPTSHTLLPPIIHHPDRPPTGSTLQGHPYDDFDIGHHYERPELENCMEFYMKDVFVCEPNGKPKWCNHCNCYKPDRSHHCSEIARCVYKMDHFCPWVGGIVAESSYKFFYQVVVYGTFYCLYLIISFSYFIHEHNKNYDGVVDANWLAALGLSCLFGLFSAGMAGSTTQLIYRNLSTIDSLEHTVKVYQLAIHDPNPPPNPIPGNRPLVHRVWLPANPMEGQQSRCFAIVNTKPGENPWRLDSTLDNFREVLGYSIWEWWLPIKMSPLVKKNNGETWYKMNEKLLERLRHVAGIETGPRATTDV